MNIVSTITFPAGDLPVPELWELKTWNEVGKILPEGGSNFCAITVYADPKGVTGGQTCWTQLDAPEIAFLQALNDAPYRSARWHYLVHEINRSIYMTVGGVDPDLAASIYEPRIAVASNDNPLFPRNQVLVLQKSATHGRIAGIPHSSDYSKYSPATHPWLFHRVYCIQFPDQPIPPVPGSGKVMDTPQGVLYKPLLDPASGYKISLGGDGHWLPLQWLYRKIS